MYTNVTASYAEKMLQTLCAMVVS